MRGMRKGRRDWKRRRKRRRRRKRKKRRRRRKYAKFNLRMLIK